MAERFPIDQLDDLVTAILARDAADLSQVDPDIAALAEVAQELRGLPSQDFKLELKDRLTKSHTRSQAMSSAAPLKETNAIHRVSTYLCFKNASAAIEFYKEAFGAKELMRLAEPSGKIGHAEIQIGESVLMMSDEYPDYGALSPESIGGSPMRMHLDVEDVDAFAEQAVAAGATITRPIADQFYGDRAGQLADPFGYTWAISSHIRDVSIEEMQVHVDAFAKQQSQKTSKGVREGFNSVTPYITVKQPDELINFVTQVFGATETFRTTGSAGGTHAEYRIGDSMVMIGGAPHIDAMPVAIHMYIPDVDAAYQRAVDAGATPLFEPADQPYGERSGAVQDSTGNRWYIATTFGPLTEIAEDLRTVTVYYHPIGAPRFIEFLEQAFGAKELMRHEEEGVLLHAKVQIGDSVVEMGESRGDSLPMPTAIYLYVEDCDAMYEQALKAGATSMMAPSDQPYGDRNAWVKDPFDNVWYLATTTISA
jgi:PhnB protein